MRGCDLFEWYVLACDTMFVLSLAADQAHDRRIDRNRCPDFNYYYITDTTSTVKTIESHMIP